MSTAIVANAVECRDTGDIDPLIASPRPVTCTEAAEVQPESSRPTARPPTTP